ncbi:hypothetical protein SAMN05428988_3233 [Chitinophaga sp. YR573]|uniref:hypothetical protein n=1 Tax=Chitinophaga sp. YR573 TaxID=1881040 RepID=UPI0008C76812|nr:hypothetical protein [Chitinophaga sp. YR573]SEW21648.1 hypothetical protein SAMN05428988_3233 [Chitinophaga sp. YR573]
MSPKAFIKYSSADMLTSGVLVINDAIPTGLGWIEVPYTNCCSQVGFPAMPASSLKKRGYIKYSKSGQVVAGSTIIRNKKPKNGYWQEVPLKRCC